MARKLNPALAAPKQPDEVLAAIVGKKPASRGQLTKKVWTYIKEKTDAQGTEDGDRRNIHISTDEKLQALAPRKKTVNMFELTKIISDHIVD